MNWIDIAWPVMGGVSLTLGLIHVLIWLRQRNQSAQLMFGLAAGSVAVLAIFELVLMHSRSPLHYFAVLRWAHVPVALVAIALVGFVRLHFKAGRPWLGITACAIRVAILLMSFLSGGSLRFKQVAELKYVDWGGATVAAPMGSFNPVMFVVEFADLLLVLFLLDAIVEVWRRTRDPTERRRVLQVCGSIIVFVIMATTWATLVALGWLHAPFVVNAMFLGVLLVTSYELGGDAIRVNRLERQLQETESSLRGSEQRMQLTADAVGLGMWTWDVESSESWLTEAGSAMLGLGTGEQFNRETLLDRVHPDDHEKILRAREDAIHRTGRFECEYRLPQPDGSMRWISATGRVEYNVTGKASRMHGVLIDITEHRLAEERFRVVVESSPTAMLMADSEGRITLANAQTERVFGYDVAELLGQGIDMLVPPGDRAGHARYRASFLEHPKARAMGPGRELFGHRKDGASVPVEVALSPIQIGRDLFVLASITDISERLKAEQEAALQRDELTHLSRITLLGEMSGSLAHELNQPLTAVLSNAQAALRFLDRDKPDLVEVRESLVQIVENDKRAGEVIRRLRAMLRKEQIEHQELQVNDVVQDVMRLINSDLLNRNVSTTLDLASDLPAVNGDRVQLQQVLLNLVINACDAMEDNKAPRSLTIRTRASDASIEVLVSDVGRGIPQEDLERVFTPFVTSKLQGMGLGLAVCRTIIQSHNGSLWATNNPTQGSTLHVLLPSAADGKPVVAQLAVEN